MCSHGTGFGMGQPIFGIKAHLGRSARRLLISKYTTLQEISHHGWRGQDGNGRLARRKAESVETDWQVNGTLKYVRD